MQQHHVVKCDICDRKVTNTPRAHKGHMTRYHNGAEFNATTPKSDPLPPQLAEILAAHPNRIFTANELLQMPELNGRTRVQIAGALGALAGNKAIPEIVRVSRGQYRYRKPALSAASARNAVDEMEEIDEVVSAPLDMLSFEGELIGRTLENDPIVLRGGHAFSVHIAYMPLGR